MVRMPGDSAVIDHKPRWVDLDKPIDLTGDAIGYGKMLGEAAAIAAEISDRKKDFRLLKVKQPRPK